MNEFINIAYFVLITATWDTNLQPANRAQFAPLNKLLLWKMSCILGLILMSTKPIRVKTQCSKRLSWDIILQPLDKIPYSGCVGEFST